MLYDGDRVDAAATAVLTCRGGMGHVEVMAVVVRRDEVVGVVIVIVIFIFIQYMPPLSYPFVALVHKILVSIVL